MGGGVQRGEEQTWTDVPGNRLGMTGGREAQRGQEGYGGIKPCPYLIKKKLNSKRVRTCFAVMG